MHLPFCLLSKAESGHDRLCRGISAAAAATNIVATAVALGFNAHLSVNAPEQAARASFALDAMARVIEELKAGKSSAREWCTRERGDFMLAINAGLSVRAVAALEHMHDPADHPTIILPFDAAHIRRQVRLDSSPLLIAHPKEILAHDYDPLQKTNHDRIVRTQRQ